MNDQTVHTVQAYDPEWQDFVPIGIYSDPKEAQVRYDVEKANRMGKHFSAAVVAMGLQRLCFQMANIYLKRLLPLDPNTVMHLQVTRRDDSPSDAIPHPPVIVVPRPFLVTVKDMAVELNESVHSMRGDVSKTWQADCPEYALLVAQLEGHLR